jgi:hypothetical protein
MQFRIVCRSIAALCVLSATGLWLGASRQPGRATLRIQVPADFTGPIVLFADSDRDSLHTRSTQREVRLPASGLIELSRTPTPWDDPPFRPVFGTGTGDQWSELTDAECAVEDGTNGGLGVGDRMVCGIGSTFFGRSTSPTDPEARFSLFTYWIGPWENRLRGLDAAKLRMFDVVKMLNARMATSRDTLPRKR